MSGDAPARRRRNGCDDPHPVARRNGAAWDRRLSRPGSSSSTTTRRRLREIRADNSADGNAFGPELLKLAARRATPGEFWEWIVIKSGDTTRLIMTEDIDWIEAAGVYVTVHAGGKGFLYRASLSSVAS